MIIHYFTLLISLLFIIINANPTKSQHSAINIAVSEHGSNDIIKNDSNNQSWQTTTGKTLIRVTRLDHNSQKSLVHYRHRRDIIDTDEIWGMAKKLAIAVFILVPLCIICCIVTTIYICIKCCCDNNKKQNQSFTSMPQPVVIHTSSPNYQPQCHQQQAPPPPQIRALENHPMLPQPSAPPHPHDDSYIERPPPYEQICTSR